MIIGWPQGIYLAIVVLSMGIALARYGEQKRDRYDWIDLILSPAITTALREILS